MYLLARLKPRDHQTRAANDSQSKGLNFIYREPTKFLFSIEGRYQPWPVFRLYLSAMVFAGFKNPLIAITQCNSRVSCSTTAPLSSYFLFPNCNMQPELGLFMFPTCCSCATVLVRASQPCAPRLQPRSLYIPCFPSTNHRCWREEISSSFFTMARLFFNIWLASALFVTAQCQGIPDDPAGPNDLPTFPADG